MSRGESGLVSRGYELREEFLPAVACARLLDAIARYREHHDVPLIERELPDRSLRYSVIDGDAVYGYLPELVDLYERVRTVAAKLSTAPLVELGNRTAGLNVNITAPGGAYRWHYDRNAVTAVLYLNDVLGGETEFYPNYRLHLRRLKHSRAQRRLDQLLLWPPVRERWGRRVVVPPLAGGLLVTRGEHCLHSVRPVAGEDERICIVMAFDLEGAVTQRRADLDGYLYSSSHRAADDPNYSA